MFRTSLKKIRLRKSHIQTKEDAEKLSEALSQNTTLELLVFDGIIFSEETSSILAISLKQHPTLRQLRFSGFRSKKI